MKFDNKPCDSNNERGAGDIGFLAGIVALFVLPFVALWAFGNSLPFLDEITVYDMLCTGARKDGVCKSKEETAGQTTYKVLTDQQTVIFWSGNGDAPKRLRNCAVRNAKNWSCSDESGGKTTYVQKMIDGQYHFSLREDSFFDASSAAFYQVPKWRWWWVRITQEMK